MWATELDTRYKFIKLDMSTRVDEQIDLRKPSLIYQISLVFWATELDTSLSSSIRQAASICRYRARGLSPLREDKVKMVIELDDLSRSGTYRARFFKRRKKRGKMGIKAIITTWSTKSKTLSRSQFVTDKKTFIF